MLKIHAGLSRKCVFTYAISMCNYDIYDAGTWAVGQITSQPCAVLENVLNQACYFKKICRAVTVPMWNLTLLIHILVRVLQLFGGQNQHHLVK